MKQIEHRRQLSCEKSVIILSEIIDQCFEVLTIDLVYSQTLLKITIAYGMFTFNEVRYNNITLIIIAGKKSIGFLFKHPYNYI